MLLARESKVKQKNAAWRKIFRPCQAANSIEKLQG
jgi:hypothetical protein